MPKIRVSPAMTMNPKRKAKRRPKKNPAPVFGKRRTGRPKGAKVKHKARPVFGRRKESIYVIRGIAAKGFYYFTGTRFDSNRNHAAFYRSHATAVQTLRSIRGREPAALNSVSVTPA